MSVQVLAMALAAECATERAYGYKHHETTTTTTTMKPEPYKKHDNTFYHRPSYKTYNGYNSHHHNNGYNSYHHNNEYTNYHHMEPRIYSPYQVSWLGNKLNFNYRVRILDGNNLPLT